MDCGEFKSPSKLFSAFDFEELKGCKVVYQKELRRNKRNFRIDKLRELGEFDVVGCGKSGVDDEGLRRIVERVERKDLSLSLDEFRLLSTYYQSDDDLELRELSSKLLLFFSGDNKISYSYLLSFPLVESLFEVISSSIKSQTDFFTDLIKNSLSVLGNLSYFNQEVSRQIIESNLLNELFILGIDCTDDLSDKFYFSISCILYNYSDYFSQVHSKYLLKGLAYKFLSIKSSCMGLNAIKNNFEKIEFNQKHFHQLIEMSLIGDDEVRCSSFEILEIGFNAGKFNQFSDCLGIKKLIKGLDTDEKLYYLRIFCIWIYTNDDVKEALVETDFLEKVLGFLYVENSNVKETVLSILANLQVDDRINRKLVQLEWISGICLVLESDSPELIGKCLDLIYKIHLSHKSTNPFADSAIHSVLESLCYHPNQAISNKSLYLVSNLLVYS